MLIEAMHPEETRVVTVHGSRVEEFDFEAANGAAARQHYLAKVTRVEPCSRRRSSSTAATATASWPSTRSIRLLPDPAGRPAGTPRRGGPRRRGAPRARGAAPPVVSRRSRGRRAEARARGADETVSAEDTHAASESEDQAEIRNESGIDPASSPTRCPRTPRPCRRPSPPRPPPATSRRVSRPQAAEPQTAPVEAQAAPAASEPVAAASARPRTPPPSRRPASPWRRR